MIKKRSSLKEKRQKCVIQQILEKIRKVFLLFLFFLPIFAPVK